MIRYFLILANILYVISNVLKNNLKFIPKEINKLRFLNGENNPILIGFSDYKVNNADNKIEFNTIIMPEGDKINNKTNLKIPVTIFYRNEKEASNGEAECNFKRNAQYSNQELSELYLFSCNISNKNDNISKVNFSETFKINNTEELNMTLSTLARASKNDITSGALDGLSTAKIISLSNAGITKQSTNSFVIRGNEINSITSSNNLEKYESQNIKLVSTKNGFKREIPCEGKNSKDKDDEFYYFLSCKSYDTIDRDLNNSYCYFEKDKTKSLLVQFGENNSTELYDYDYRYKKKSSGLSTGGIIAIIIPSIIVLLGVLGLAMALRNKSPTPPLRDMVNNNNNNNTVGVVGNSSEVVVHQ